MSGPRVRPLNSYARFLSYYFWYTSGEFQCCLGALKRPLYISMTPRSQVGHQARTLIGKYCTQTRLELVERLVKVILEAVDNPLVFFELLALDQPVKHQTPL